MKFVMLKGKFTNKYFGWQLSYKYYTLQWCDKKLALFNNKTYEWTEII